MKTDQLSNKPHQSMDPPNKMDEALSLFRMLDVNQQTEYLDALQSRANKRFPAPVPRESA